LAFAINAQKVIPLKSAKMQKWLIAIEEREHRHRLLLRSSKHLFFMLFFGLLNIAWIMNRLYFL